jgi:acylphosphatase
MHAAHLKIEGRVQGVWYRASTREQAVSLGLFGWVKNMPDGNVEAFAQGPKEMIEALAVWCRQGPPHASVTKVDVTWTDPDAAIRTFDVRY